MKTIIIGIAGGTGSGKTTLTEKLRDHFGANEVSVLNHDSYYKRHDELPYEERCKLNCGSYAQVTPYRCRSTTTPSTTAATRP